MRHPGIIRVLESFEANNTYYYAMEYVDGGSLDSYILSKGELSEKEAVDCINAIGSALSYMHEQKMLHLDLKPKNIMLCTDGSPVLIDFGLSKQYDSTGEPESSSTIGLGTPGYAPIEQANSSSGRDFAATLDIYALGGTFYKMLTGKSPVDASIILNDGFPEDELRNSGVSDRSIAAIRRAMSPQRKSRPQSVQEFLSLLGDDSSISSVLSEEDESTRIEPASGSSCFASRTERSAYRNSDGDESRNYVETALGINMEMVYVTGVIFTMGATPEQGDDAQNDERPAHRVNLSGYYIGAFEVTQGQWEKVMGTSVSQQRDKAKKSWLLRGVGSDYPMYYVSWDEAQSFCQELSRRTGKKYVLPTEAQWEFAARGGSKNERTKYSGSNAIDSVACYAGNSGFSTNPIGTKRPNVLGLYDMSGNVWEWCSDWYGNYLGTSQTNPMGSSSGLYRVIRGGSWDGNARCCRVSSRYFNYPGNRGIHLGFRVVCLL